MSRIIPNSPAAKALDAFAEEEGISPKAKVKLSRLSGRGYRQPTTVAGWQEIWQVIKKHLGDAFPVEPEVDT